VACSGTALAFRIYFCSCNICVTLLIEFKIILSYEISFKQLE
jgi:hypothetical protein